MAFVGQVVYPAYLLLSRFILERLLLGAGGPSSEVLAASSVTLSWKH